MIKVWRYHREDKNSFREELTDATDAVLYSVGFTGPEKGYFATEADLRVFAERVARSFYSWLYDSKNYRAIEQVSDKGIFELFKASPEFEELLK